MWRASALMALVCLQAWAAPNPTVTCATCHRREAQSQPATSMAHALEPVADCTILRQHPQLSFRSGPYQYTITREGSRSVYSVTDGVSTITVPIGWAFGLGDAGQTYVFERDGIFYESRVSFFKAIAGLDLTLGAAGAVPKDIAQAAGREMTHEDVVSCFACHTTGAVHGKTMQLDQLKPGVLCQNCHPEADRHMQRIQASDAQGAAIPHLANMTSEETSEFCGRCHRTWESIAANGPHTIANVRFQPYRLTNSKCYDAADQRIGCLACHNPHEEVVHAAASYDKHCLACHAGKQKTCPVAAQNCTNCHMPKIDLPGAHRQFTDHQIRIVRANQPYPR